MPQYLRPSSTVSSTFGAGDHTSIDEASFSDTDYIETPSNTAASATFGLSSAQQPSGAWTGTLSLRGAKVGGKSASMTATWKDAGGTSTGGIIGATTLTTTYVTVSDPSAAAALNPVGHTLDVSASFSGGGSATVGRISWAQVEIPNPPAPAQPAQPTVNVSTPEQMAVSVPAVSGATSYDFYRSSDGGAFSIRASNQASPSYTEGASNFNTTQTAAWYVVAKNLGGSSPASPNSVAAVTSPSPPSFSLATSDSQVKVTVTRKSYSTKYKIYRGLAGGARSLVHTSLVIPAGGDGIYEWTDTGLTNGTAYDYHVTSEPQTPTVRESAASAVQSGTPNPIEFLRPMQDMENGQSAWGSSRGGFTNLWSDIDESTLDTSDYIYLAASYAEYYTVALSDPVSTPDGNLVRIVVKNNVPSSMSNRLDVYLTQAGSQVAYRSAWDTNDTFDLTPQEIASIVNWNGLQLQFFTLNDWGSGSPTVYQAYVEYSITPSVPTTVVGTEVQALFNEQALATQTSSLRWNDIAVVSSSRQVVFNATVPVALTRQQVWNQRTAVGQSRQSVWNQQANVGLSRQALFNERSAVGLSRQALFNERTLVGNSDSVPWHDRALVANADSLLWNQRSAVGLSLQAVFNDLSTAALAKQVLFTDMTTVGSARQALWGDLGVVGSQDDVVWNTQGLISVGTDKSLRWNLASVVAQARSALFHDRAVVGNSDIARWNDLVSVAATRQAQWHDRANVGSSRQALFNDRSLVAAVRQALFNERAPVGSSRQALWNGRALVAASPTFMWNDRTVVAMARQGLWADLNLVGQSRSARWNQRANVGKSATVYWNALSSAVIAVQAALAFNVLANVGADEVVRFNDLTSVASTKTARWNDRATVGANKSARWNDRATAGRSLILRSNVLTGVATSLVLRWADLARIAADGDILWSNYAPVAASYGISWSDLQAVTRDIDLRYEQMQRAGAETQVVFADMAVLGVDVDLLWDVIRIGKEGGRKSTVVDVPTMTTNTRRLLVPSKRMLTVDGIRETIPRYKQRSTDGY